MKTKIEDWARDSEEERLEEIVKGMTFEEREKYLNCVANRYLAELKKVVDLREEYWKKKYG